MTPYSTCSGINLRSGQIGYQARTASTRVASTVGGRGLRMAPLIVQRHAEEEAHTQDAHYKPDSTTCTGCIRGWQPIQSSASAFVLGLSFSNRSRGRSSKVIRD